ncbi:hypothetical protein GCM10027343_24590 [Noviherbaspirillum agri]
METPQNNDPTLLAIIKGALNVRRHIDLLKWLQGDMQRLLPHELLLAAWGNPAGNDFKVDLLSSLAGLRTTAASDSAIRLARRVHAAWAAHGGQPCVLPLSLLPSGDETAADGFDEMLRAMGSVVVHGLRDCRNNQVCLYLLFSTQRSLPPTAGHYLELLAPYMDTALRQVELLPAQRHLVSMQPWVQERSGLMGALSGREADIVRWARAGKTNHEIGLILGISQYTVKNHLQRIFQKLDVTSRAQLADRLRTFGTSAAYKSNLSTQ